jgi:hypothetical protein
MQLLVTGKMRKSTIRLIERPHTLWETRVEEGRSNIYLHPSPAQMVIMLGDATITAVSGGTGCGKSSLGPFWLLHQLDMQLGEDALVVGYTKGELERAVFPSLFPVLEASQFKGGFNGSEMVYKTPYGNIFFCTNQNPKAIFGVHPGPIWLDEGAMYSLETWRAVRSRMDRPQSRLAIFSTPYGENWFLTEVVQRWRDGDPDYKVVYMSSLDNPTYPRDTYYRDKREMDVDEFMMSHEGRIRRRHGLVYPDFGKDRIVERPVRAKCYAGFDLGLVDPNAFTIMSYEHPSKYGEEAWIVHDEWSQSGLDDEKIAENIFPLIRQYAIDTIFYDNHAGQTVLDVRKTLEKKPYFMDNIRWIPMSETIEPGVNALRGITRRKTLYVDPKCEYLLDNLATYSVLNGKPEAKLHTDSVDSCRYCVRGIQIYGDTELESGDVMVYKKPTHAEELFRIRPETDDLYDTEYGNEGGL